jgi:hypothetical protein
MADPTRSTSSVDNAQPSIERTKMILTELADAAQSAALSVVDEQRARAAAKLGGVAAAARAAARSLEQSDSQAAARYIHSVAGQIEAVADTVRTRDWAGLLADLDNVANRQPTMFVAGAMALGFLAGRFISALTRGQPDPGMPPARVETNVTAAVSSASGNGELVDWPPPSQSRELP